MFTFFDPVIKLLGKYPKLLIRDVQRIIRIFINCVIYMSKNSYQPQCKTFRKKLNNYGTCR